MPTTIRLQLGDIPFDFDPDAGAQLSEVLALIKAARGAGCTGQRLGGGFGKARPVVEPAVHGNRLCCPTHAGQARAALARKDWGSGVVYVCGVKEGDAWCKYRLSQAEYDTFAAKLLPTVAPAAPASTSTPPKTTAEAEQRFFARYGETVGGSTWQAVQRYLGHLLPRPASVEDWIAVAEQVRDRQHAA